MPTIDCPYCHHKTITNSPLCPDCGDIVEVMEDERLRRVYLCRKCHVLITVKFIPTEKQVAG
jgi:DNA-directed RNA polymerase subunit RPC12/RpoP